MQKLRKRIGCMLLAVVLLACMLPQETLAEKEGGAADAVLSGYAGKVVSILGDSISTFSGYLPETDGFNLNHRSYYPRDDVLTDVNETWWMQLITALDAKLGINDSWAGSRVSNTLRGDYGDLGEKICMASLTRIQNLGANGDPDVILFFGGTNDIAGQAVLGTFNPQTAPAEADLMATKWPTVVEAYVAAILRMQHFYPNAQLIALLPGHTKTYYSDQDLAKYNKAFTAICTHYGVPYIDVRSCGITMDMLPDGIHPNADGMDCITGAVLKTLSAQQAPTEGENVVHTVTHTLTGAKSTLCYYKGISDGKPFVTTISGEEVTVTVTMGGVDITDSVYADGVVTIPCVTDDLVITATGIQRCAYQDHLQQLPDALCTGMNLWTVLEPESQYYTASGWGTNVAGTAYSITIPIEAGDRIWATSIQKAGINGGTANGVRLTWFDEYDVLRSMTAREVYAEFLENGYLTAPEGAAAVNIPMWNYSAEWEIYVLSREHIYEDGICAVCGGSERPLITRQPTDTGARRNEKMAVSLEANGERLQYQWYWRNVGQTEFNRSACCTDTYYTTMTDWRDGRQIYCVVTDNKGNTVVSDLVTLYRVLAVELEIVSQPEDAEAALNGTVAVSLSAVGEQLQYQWYYRDAGQAEFSRSPCRTNTYYTTMNSSRHGREIYCVITDALGNTVISDTAKLCCTDPVDSAADTPKEMRTENTVGISVCARERENLCRKNAFRPGSGKRFLPRSVLCLLDGRCCAEKHEKRNIYYKK